MLTSTAQIAAVEKNNLKPSGTDVPWAITLETQHFAHILYVCVSWDPQGKQLFISQFCTKWLVVVDILWGLELNTWAMYKILEYFLRGAMAQVQNQVDKGGWYPFPRDYSNAPYSCREWLTFHFRNVGHSYNNVRLDLRTCTFPSSRVASRVLSTPMHLCDVH